MYLVIHTMTIAQSDCVMQAQFFHALSPERSVQLGRRLRVSYHARPIADHRKLSLRSNLKSIVKRKLSHVKHHIRTIKIASPNHVQEYPQKIEECPSPTVLQRCNSITNLAVEKPVADKDSDLLNCESTVQQTSQWLVCNRFSALMQTFAGFSGADMLRMSKEDLVQICGQADGIRLFNALHSKSVSPTLTVYVCRENSAVFNAVYLMSHNSLELVQRLSAVIGIVKEHIHNVYFQGPHGIHVHLNDDVVKHIKEESMFFIELIPDNTNGYVVILKPIIK